MTLLESSLSESANPTCKQNPPPHQLKSYRLDISSTKNRKISPRALATMVNSPTLLGLPVELQIEIARQLDSDALSALRLCCRELAVNTMDHFGKEYFLHRTHLYTTHSLLALRDITETTKLARHMKFITLVVVGVENQRSSPPSCLISKKDLATADSERLWYEEERHNIQANGTTYLQQIFTNLKKLGVGRSLEIMGRLWDTRPGDDVQQIKDGSEDCARYKRPTYVYGTSYFIAHVYPWATLPQIEYGSISFAAQGVKDALIRTEHAMEWLDLGCDGTGYHEQQTNFWELSNSQLASLSASWSSLKSLRLAFEAAVPSKSLSALLSSATGLDEIGINSRHAAYLQVFDQNLRRNQLKSVLILQMDCEYEELVRFVARQSKSLEILDFGELLLGTADEPENWELWKLFFGVASKCLNLKDLRLFCLLAWSQHSGHKRYFLPNGRDSYHLHVTEGEVESQMVSISKIGIGCDTAEIEDPEIEDTDEEEDGEEEDGDEEGGVEEDGEEEDSENDADDEESNGRFDERVMRGVKEWKLYEQM